MRTEHRHVRRVLDTKTVIGLPNIADAGALPAEPAITAVTLAELSVGPLVVSDWRERARRQAHLQQAETDFEVLTNPPFGRSSSDSYEREDFRATTKNKQLNFVQHVVSLLKIGGDAAAAVGLSALRQRHTVERVSTGSTRCRWNPRRGLGRVRC